tara:strand:+ start:5506 stop:5733 length:228 start_codon:yes stop_codon:yes gene_type:complete
MTIKKGEVELEKPISFFLFIAFSVGFGVFLFTLFLYGMLQLFTSGGFGELNSMSGGDDGDDDRERIDGNEDLEDV